MASVTMAQYYIGFDNITFFNCDKICSVIYDEKKKQTSIRTVDGKVFDVGKTLKKLWI